MLVFNLLNYPRKPSIILLPTLSQLTTSLSMDVDVKLLTFAACLDVNRLVCGTTHIVGNRLDLVMTDAPDIVDESFFCSFDHCFASCDLLGAYVDHNTITCRSPRPLN